MNWDWIIGKTKDGQKVLMTIRTFHTNYPVLDQLTEQSIAMTPAEAWMIARSLKHIADKIVRGDEGFEADNYDDVE